MTQVDAFVQRAVQHGPKGLLDDAEGRLTVAEYRSMLRRLLAVGIAVQCATPGCICVFIPRNGRERFHSAACRRSARPLGARGRAAVSR